MCTDTQHYEIILLFYIILLFFCAVIIFSPWDELSSCSSKLSMSFIASIIWNRCVWILEPNIYPYIIFIKVWNRHSEHKCVHNSKTIGPRALKIYLCWIPQIYSPNFSFRNHKRKAQQVCKIQGPSQSRIHKPKLIWTFLDFFPLWRLIF